MEQTNCKTSFMECANDAAEKKTDNVLEEMTRMKIILLGISDMSWNGNDLFRKDVFYVAYSGKDDHNREVGIIVHPSLASQVESTWAFSDHVILTKVKNLCQSIGVIQCYAPTCDKDDADVDGFYGDFE